MAASGHYGDSHPPSPTSFAEASAVADAMADTMAGMMADRPWFAMPSRNGIGFVSASARRTTLL